MDGKGGLARSISCQRQLNSKFFLRLASHQAAHHEAFLRLSCAEALYGQVSQPGDDYR